MTGFLSGIQLLKKNGDSVEKVDGHEATKGKIIALYFSAMWCPSCRQFTPKLQRFYETLKESGRPFEIVLVSRDRAEDDLLEYFQEHNGEWLALPYGDPHIQEFLKNYQVPTIPALKIIKEDGTLVVDGARMEVQENGRDEPEAVFDAWEKIVKE